MKLAACSAALIFLFAAASSAVAQAERPANGTIVSSSPCAADPVTTYETYVAGAQKFVALETEEAREEGYRYATEPKLRTKEEFETRRKEAGRIECRRLRYVSDGLQLVAYEWKPKASGSQKLPLIIFNRGGNREFGKLNPWIWPSRFALEGFVVIASQYRGNDGGEGREEFGGAEVRDILNLIPLAQSLGYVDTKNVFMLGWSRGGMMTALALKQGIAVNAAALGGPVTNLLHEAERRPDWAVGVFKELIPGYDERTEEVLRERSAIFWPEQLRVPLLILQGGADWRVDPGATLDFAKALQRAGATYELVLYAGDDHGISLNAEDRNRRIAEWFRKHMRK
jgi:dipeptidyl aminopeptidase/acylaminoacyl peptidase